MIEGKSLDEMKNTEEKQLLMLVKEGGKPFMRKVDGWAVKVDEDKTIEYEDWEKNQRTLKVPAGSYVVCDAGSDYPKIITAEDFEKKNKFLEEKTEKKSDDSDKPKLGMETMY